MSNVSSRKIVVFLIIIIGISTLFSSLLINPWIGKYYRTNAINYSDVMFGYFIVSLILGVLIITTGLLVSRKRLNIIENLSALFIIISMFILSDRLLLAVIGLPLWKFDPVIHYRHRPNKLVTWGSRGQKKLIKINKYGHHDDDFSREKPQDEFRGVMIGDSITMGHGVTSSETFSNQLEKMLEAYSTQFNSYQIINTGVQGYSVFQEYQILKESIMFEPDFIAIGFCMNDLAEPFVVNRNFGGTGMDYHGVMQTSNLFLGYLMNETGYGRLIQKIRKRKVSQKTRKLWELNNVYELSQSSDNPKAKKVWEIILTDLSKIYDFTKKINIDLVLLIFPETFQLLDDNLKNPQKILTEHALQHDIDVIDFTQIFEDLIFNDAETVVTLKQKQFSYQDIRRLYKKRIKRFFLDSNHYTVEGHNVVAGTLFDYVRQNNLITGLNNEAN
jgi:hypothetical protein